MNERHIGILQVQPHRSLSGGSFVKESVNDGRNQLSIRRNGIRVLNFTVLVFYSSTASPGTTIYELIS